jgi:carboxylesterase type B
MVVDCAPELSPNKVTCNKIVDILIPLGPYVDGKVVPMQPLDALRQGYFQKKPFMIGTNTEETRIFIFEAWNTTVSPMLYAEALIHDRHTL